MSLLSLGHELTEKLHHQAVVSLQIQALTQVGVSMAQAELVLV